MAWEALKKSINGLINKVNVTNIKHIVPELFGENLVRGRGLFCRSIMKAQAASLPFTPLYACMVAIVNTKLHNVGQLLANRLVMQFRKAYRRNDKAVCLSSLTFIAHLTNYQVINEMLAAQILLLLLHEPTDDRVEIAVGLTREVGHHIEEMNSAIALAVFDQFRNILHEADIDKRVQYMIEVLFQVRRDKYKDNPAIKEELDLIEEEDQITHQIDLEGDLKIEDGLNVFKFDPDFQENEEAYRKLKAQILGEDSDAEDGSEAASDESDSDDEEAQEERAIEVRDQTNADLVNLRKTIYLTIQSSSSFEDACHRLMKISLPKGMEPELPSMIIECCSQERTYTKFFGLIGERFAKLNRLWKDLFENAFAHYYDIIHRYETNKLRNVARFFGHQLSTDSIAWHVFYVVKLTEEDTTSSSRIFLKILLQDLAEAMGLKELLARFKDPALQSSYTGLFPKDPEKPQDTRFAINYFTSIGMGAATEDMREWLKNLPKPVPVALPAAPTNGSAKGSRGRAKSIGSVSSYSSYTGSSYSDSRSRSRSRSGLRSKPRRRSRTPPRRSQAKGRPTTKPRSSSSSSSSASRSQSPVTPPPPSIQPSALARPASPPPDFVHPSRRAAVPRSPPRRVPEPRREPTRGEAPVSVSVPVRSRRGRSPTRSVSRRREYAPSPRSRGDLSVSRDRARTPLRGARGKGEGGDRQRKRAVSYTSSLSGSRSLSRSRSLGSSGRSRSRSLPARRPVARA